MEISKSVLLVKLQQIGIFNESEDEAQNVQRFEAPVFSLQIGNRSEWDCFPEEIPTVFFGRDFSFCAGDRKKGQEILRDNGLRSLEGVIALVVDAGGGTDCPEEEKYETALLYEAEALIDIRKGLPVRKLMLKFSSFV